MKIFRSNFSKPLLARLPLLGLVILLPVLAGSFLLNLGAVSCTKDLVSTGKSNYLKSGLTPPPGPAVKAVCESSLPYFDNALKPDPADNAALSWYTRAEFAQANYAAVSNSLAQAADVEPYDSWLNYMRVLTGFNIAEPETTKTLWSGLKSPEQIFLAVGTNLDQNGQTSQALALYTKVVSFYPAFANVHIAAAEILNKQNRSDEALDQYVAGFASLKEPSSWVKLDKAYYNQALLYSNKNQYPAAIASMQRAVELNPAVAAYQANLGAFYGVVENYELADYWLNKAEKVDPDSGLIDWIYGNYYARRRLWEPAITKYEQALRLTPAPPASYYGYLGAAYLGQKNKGKAVSSLQKALQLDPQNVAYKRWYEQAQALQ